MKKAPKNVDTYIESAPSKVRAKLEQLRKIIKSTAPLADERISYGIPYYAYKGRLAYFMLAKAHIGLYIPTPVIEEYKSELKDYETAKATVRLPLDQKLPVKLIQTLIKARLQMNEGKSKK